jgi:hypothetical protein
MDRLNAGCSPSLLTCSFFCQIIQVQLISLKTFDASSSLRYFAEISQSIRVVQEAPAFILEALTFLVFNTFRPKITKELD